MTSNHRHAHLKSLVELGAPFTAWDVPIPEFTYCSVTGDNITGGTLANQHLIHSGRQRIAFLGGPEGELTVQYRFQGYKNALQTVGRSLDPNLLSYIGKLLAKNLIQFIQTGVVTNITTPVELVIRQSA